ncbi:hypothetical protein BU23DRAFT_575070 [Bimuria novae-zelandiae CBS 107.79]|uniref:Uncharacterized protein n=1 Tax=Bimuria novae-zelandiae CBS 107.79 TaxID=1447943 RepID=A0A6A5UQQ8_9PLEO|nr:hypothetical protein BU23DRAFT_575070 [Bimuria novae-zelandiae CBS 107.79]
MPPTISYRRVRQLLWRWRRALRAWITRYLKWSLSLLRISFLASYKRPELVFLLYRPASSKANVSLTRRASGIGLKVEVNYLRCFLLSLVEREAIVSDFKLSRTSLS